MIQFSVQMGQSLKYFRKSAYAGIGQIRQMILFLLIHTSI